MSSFLISKYLSAVDKIVRYGGSKNESSIKNAFASLINDYAETNQLILIPELEYKTKSGNIVYPDGTLKDAIRLSHGWWESKDVDDNLEKEIENKISKGYPTDNILFEDSKTVILIQNDLEVGRCLLTQIDDFNDLILKFINYERPEVTTFRQAIDKFKIDLPDILISLRKIIKLQETDNNNFIKSREELLELIKKSINPEITKHDVNELLIQHMLSEEIFKSIFNESQFHRENNIALVVTNILDTFFIGNLKRNSLARIEHYYLAIRRYANNIVNHHEKQKFLNAIYENFYKAYDPKQADKLGIVYTPNEVVRFIVESTDFLSYKYFNKLLADKGVNILDPCTGTGTFVSEIIEYIPSKSLIYKYKNELFCNEIEILPYYIANLNIEYTFKQKIGIYDGFKNISLVDTLDHSNFQGKQLDLMAMSVENLKRIQHQNDSKISIIIGNPPYYANQASANDDNQSRNYNEVDKRIKQTYIKESSASKTKRYDMYSRFIRWASDRLDGNGIIAFITNSNFITSKEADGFRKVIAREFDAIYLIDLGGNIRANPKLSGTKHNIFGIQTPVAISFLIRKSGLNSEKKCDINYLSIIKEEEQDARTKLDWLSQSKLKDLNFDLIEPDLKYNWLNKESTKFSSYIELANKSTKNQKGSSLDNSVFKLFQIGVSTNRDEWVTDVDLNNLKKKMKFFIKQYFSLIKKEDYKNPIIKWSRDLKAAAMKHKKEEYIDKNIIPYDYRPFSKRYIYMSKLYIDNKGPYFPYFNGDNSKQNKIICLTINKQVPFTVQVTNSLYDLAIGYRSAFGLALYNYDSEKGMNSNITDFAINNFRDFYQDKKITAEDIFSYTYAILHNPLYCEEFKTELQTSFPRIPYVKDFRKYVQLGEDLISLHLDYEKIEPYNVEIHNESLVENPNPILKVDMFKGEIHLDKNTFISNIPREAWNYKIGFKSAIECALEQFKRKKYKHEVLSDKFDNYSWLYYKKKAIHLLPKIIKLSINSTSIINQIKEIPY